jgi:1,4-alpha-glucan branching enzyme
MKLGASTFVLHSHLPYCRMAGRWPHGEEWLHEAASETYIPLLNGLYDLVEADSPVRLTLGLTPVLVEQLSDPLVLDHLVSYLEERCDAAEADIPRFEASGEGHRSHLAHFYWDWYAHILRSFQQRFDSDIIGAFRQLQDEGHIEILTSAATHGYLPLLGRDSSIYGQMRTGVGSYHRHFGQLPRAVWLPECAYRPAYVSEGGHMRPGEEMLLNQTAWELLLLQASDWPFLISTGQAKDYATRRFNGNLARFGQLATLAEAGAIGEGGALAAELYEQDNVFPDIDYRWFGEHKLMADG